ncbi:MAG TPA: mannose-6-phosphate isomerase, class I [Polyangiaceae bacterium]|nr:mannose-6-phosphate isomerase, class I [Polyangiaceae bacterium]
MAMLLEGRIQRYPWGSTTLIQDLCGWPRDGQPIAELWFGSHPKAPSRVYGTDQDLLQLLQQDRPLPFLLKLIAVARPLSIQAHPNTDAAQAGHQREEQRGIPLNAAERSYPDPNHKPELLVALSEFHALAGFDNPQRVDEALALIASEDLRGLAGSSSRTGDLQSAFSALLHSDGDARARMLQALRSTHAPQNAKLTLAQRLLGEYPDDLGALLSIFLADLVLKPGQALYVTSGLLHCYLSGLAVEIMANSDNVLRCGLTTKHIDVPELLHVLDAAATPVVLQGAAAPGADDAAYPVAVPEFLLSRLELHGSISLQAPQAEIVLAVAAPITVTDNHGQTTVAPGQAAFIAAGTPYTVQGTGPCFRARAGAPGATIRPAAMS